MTTDRPKPLILRIPTWSDQNGPDEYRLPLERHCGYCLDGRQTGPLCGACSGTGLVLNDAGAAILELVRKYRDWLGGPPM